MQVHPNFQIQGRSFANTNELLKYVEENFPSHFLFLSSWFDDKEYVMAQTSGSTGKPKNIRLAKKAMIQSAKTSIDFFKLPPDTKALLNLSSQFIAGKMMWVRALTGGWDIYISSPESKEIKKILSNENFDFGAMVPLQLINNLELIDRFDKIIVGGGALNEKFISQLINKKAAVFATYGMTETITHIAVKPLNQEANQLRRGLQYKVFTALPNISFRVDKRACLVINAPKIISEEIITNDVVELIDDKHFIWKGRYDHIINSGGIKIHPEEIEKRLEPYIDVPFFIGAKEDEKLGEKVVLLIQGEKEIKIPFDKILPKYYIPKSIYYLPSFIWTDSQKIKRFETLKLVDSRKLK